MPNHIKPNIIAQILKVV